MEYLGVIITVVVLLSVAPVLWWAFKLVTNLQKGAAEERRLLQTGTPAQGQILAAQPTGTTVNDNPQVQFTILVTPPGGQPYQAQVTKLVSMFEMSQYQVGMPCQVRIDPMNPAHVAIFGAGGMGAMGMGGMMGGMPGGMGMGGAPQMTPMGGAQQGWPGAPQQGMPQQQGWPGAPQQGTPQQQGWPGAPQQGMPPQGMPPQGGPPPGQGGWGGPGQGGPPQGGWGR